MDNRASISKELFKRLETAGILLENDWVKSHKEQLKLKLHCQKKLYDGHIFALYMVYLQNKIASNPFNVDTALLERLNDDDGA
jgi:hypothetical protein